LGSDDAIYLVGGIYVYILEELIVTFKLSHNSFKRSFLWFISQISLNVIENIIYACYFNKWLVVDDEV
jgi:hypothetical protein